jgi:LPXTG-site transpeptidase (sortase) family protein
MDLSLDRRTALKAGAGAAVAVVAGTVLADSAQAATKKKPVAKKPPPPKIVSVGLVGAPRLWGLRTVRDKKTRKRVKVPVTKKLYLGTEVRILNKGGLCHFVGTPDPNAVGNSVFFGHRTSYGGLLRKSERFKLGDQIMISYGGKTKTYAVVTVPFVVKKDDSDAVFLWTPPPDKAGITVVSCTKPNKKPTSIKYRLVVRAVEV